MKVEDAVYVSYGITKNLGNFESFRFDFGITRVLKPGESHEVVAREVADSVDALLNEKLQELNGD